MIIRNDTAIRNCIHVVFDPWRDAGTGYTPEQQRAWLEEMKLKVRSIIKSHISDSDECDIFQSEYEIIEDDLGRLAAPRMIVICRFDGVKKWGKKDANEDLTAAWQAMQPIIETIGELSAYVWATGTPGEKHCIAASELVQV